jgi:hypothetical protein
MITEEILNAIIAGQAVEYRHSPTDKWEIRCLNEGRWCEPIDGKGWVPVSNVDTLKGILTVLAKYEWRLIKESRDWKGALEWLKEGKKVKRGAWQAPCWLVQDPSGSLQWQDSTCARPDIYVGYYRFNAKDFEATDWEIVE